MDELPQEPYDEGVPERHSQWKIWILACVLAAALFVVCVVVAVNVMGASETSSGAVGGTPMEATNGGAEPLPQESNSAEMSANVQSDASSGESESGSSGLIAGQQPETSAQMNAFMSAKLHMSEMPYSHAGIVSVLQSEGYSRDDAVYAADKLGVDWNAKAAEMAQQYVDTMEFTREDLLDQLMYEGFTAQEAAAGVAAIGM